MLGAAALLASCNGMKSEGEGTEAESSNAEVEQVHVKSKEDVKGQAFLDHYLELQHALVQSDTAAAHTAVHNIHTWAPDTKSLVAENASLVEMRNALPVLTEKVEALVMNGEVKSTTLYKQYCPMAMENTGAAWFASTKAIENPYYGESMMTCGETKKVLIVEN